MKLTKSLKGLPILALVILAISGMGIGATLYTLYMKEVTTPQIIPVNGLLVKSIQANPTINANGFNTEPYYLGTETTTLAVQYTGGVPPVAFKNDGTKHMFLAYSSINLATSDVLHMKVKAYYANNTEIPTSQYTVSASYVSFKMDSFGSPMTTVTDIGAITNTANDFTLNKIDYTKWNYAPSEAIVSTANDGNAIGLYFKFNPIYNDVGVGQLTSLESLSAKVTVTFEVVTV